MAEDKDPQQHLLIANPRKQRPFLLRVGLWAICLAAFWLAVGTAAVGLVYLAVVDDVPEAPRLDQYNPPETTRIYSQSGVLLAEFAIERRDVIENSASRTPDWE